MKDIFIIIPTLNPNKELLSPFLKELKKEFKNILVVNDGCRDEYNDYFKQMEKDGIIVFHHYINLGKGRAMKDAFNYLLHTYPSLKGVVTADSDGQHSVKDIVATAKMILERPDALILGCRNFDLKNVPKRNRFGNKTTSVVMKTFVGLTISDTQTGLRGLSKEVMIKVIACKGERFEYETNQLIDTINLNIPIVEVPIQTIYVNGNSESHFNPIKDSLAIYKLFFKYILASISSFALDLILFTVFYHFLTGSASIIIATILARIISGVYNYAVNAKVVFRNQNKSSFFKYLLLCLTQMLVSGALVTAVVDILNMNATLTKVLVDAIIFIVNFIIQREWIFKNEK